MADEVFFSTIFQFNEDISVDDYVDNDLGLKLYDGVDADTEPEVAERIRHETKEFNKKRREAYENRLFANFFGRTKLSFVSVQSKLPEGTMQQSDEPPDEIRIACISSDLLRGEKGDIVLKDTRDNCKLGHATDNAFDAAQWQKMRLVEFEEALKKNPDIVCFGEFTYPPPTVNPDKGLITEVIDGYGRNRRKFEKKMVDALKDADSHAFVFLGSYHCLVSLYNVGVIHPLGKHDDKLDVVKTFEHIDGVAKAPEHCSIKLPITQAKRFPARKIGENTRVPAGLEFQMYKTKIGVIAVLICSDVVDLNQFMFIARKNLSTEPLIDFVLVPSYNRSSKFNSMCRELSYLANTVVIVVNANNDDEEFPDTELYACGCGLQELKGPGKIYVKHKIERTWRPVDEVKRESTLHTFTIYEKNIRDLRDAVQKNHFGLRRGGIGNNIGKGNIC